MPVGLPIRSLSKLSADHDAGARVSLHEGRHLEQRLAGQDLDLPVTMTTKSRV